MPTVTHNVKRFSRQLLVSAGVLLVAAVVFVIYVRGEKQIDHANLQRQQSFLLADELRQSSDDLTRMVRMYVLTADPLYKQHYQEILDIRDGKKPRPLDYQKIYWDLVLTDDRRPRPVGEAVPLTAQIQKAGFTADELARLALAKERSDALTRTEFAAMQLMETSLPPVGPYHAEAIRLLHDVPYLQAKADIMGAINQFEQMADQRTQAAVRSAEVNASVLRLVFILLGWLLLALLWSLWRSLNAILGGSVNELYARIIRLGNGDFTAPVPLTPGTENSVLGWLAATQTNLQRIEAAQRASEEKFRLAFEHANAGLFLVGLDGRILKTNARANEMFGYASGELQGKTVNDLSLPEDLTLSPQAMQDLISGRSDHATFEKRYRHKRGHIVYGLVSIALVRDTRRQPDYFISQVQDITQRYEAEERLRISEERLRLLAESARDVVWTMSPQGQMTYVSPSVQKVRGYTPEEVMQQTLAEMQPPESQAFMRGYFSALLADIQAGRQPQTCRGELEYLCKNGATYWAEVIVAPVLNSAGSVVEVVGVSRDIAEHKRYEQELKQAKEATEVANRALQAANAELIHIATTDPLTGVLNRRHFHEIIEIEMARAQRHGQPLSLIMFDIDHFKQVNDTFGHQAGDQVLINLVELTQKNLRIGDYLARWGGEEFVVLLPYCAASEAMNLAERLRDLFAHLTTPGVGTVTASYGVAELQTGERQDDWFKRMDNALYAAKAAGRNAVRLG
ncbi:sensor domain-containing diguanylate cyclase [Rhodoferax sp.]|uniref:PAS domain S-box protein n=1 Tax=Rhodoferax sp. TaxID=50421 RepID=UPI002610A8E8|nr:sensor domain-containing diguanylate cyclase [Rhodoferax sp.]MDD2926772.1 PAS domain S-box protein [Rhodoferax sp.]